MTKKQLTPNQSSSGGLKKGKIKRKQMFNELQTVQEQKINNNEEQAEQANEDRSLIKIDEEYLAQEQKIAISKQKSIEQVCEVVNQLMAKNKIGVKNAFDVPIIDLFDLVNFSKAQNQNSWKTLSSTLENDYKIYAYRVDAIHSITYSILNIISRRSTETQEKMKPQLQKNIQNTSSNQFSDLKDSFLQSLDSEKTFLQMDSGKINISMIECAMTSDPALQRTKRLFDEPGLKGMLTNSININKNLELSLFSKISHDSYSTKLSQMNQVDTKLVEHPLKVFESIEKIKSDVNKILDIGDSNILTNKQLEQIWNNVKKRGFVDWADPNQKVWLDVEDPECRQNFDLMIDQNSQHHALFDSTHRKFIGDFIKLKNAPKKIMTEKEMILDGERWLNELDKKYLGIKGNPLKSQPIIKQAVRAIDDVNFLDTQIFERDFILRKENPTKQIHEQTEDKFLMTIRSSHEFRIQKILTLREQPEIQLHAIEEQMALQNQHDHFLQRQIDVKRQMTSIKEIKDNLLIEIENQPHTSFTDVYQSYCKKEEEISPALCFLTLLHLANENNLSFESTHGQSDFLIKLPAH